MLPETKIKIDELDYKLIQELKIDSRRSVRQLAKSLNESPSTIYNRVKRLEAKEVIRKWTVALDYSMLNLDTIGFIFIVLDKPINGNTEINYTLVTDRLKKVKGVCEIHYISGNYDILVKIRSDSVKSIGALIMQEIRIIPGVSKTVTNTCFSSIMEEWDVIDFK